MIKLKKKILFIILSVVSLFSLVGCKEEEEKTKGALNAYYLNVEETRIQQEEYIPKHKNTKEMVNEFFKVLDTEAKDSSFINLLPKDVRIIEYDRHDNILVINFNEKYLSMSKQREVLTRCGIVRTFSQIPGVDYLKFLVKGKELTRSDGAAVGLMSDQTFVENSGKEINSYLNSQVNLYFASKEGDQLVKETRKVYYNCNVPLERVVVEQLLKGPTKEGSRSTIPSETKILGVTVADKVCYINLDSTFSTQVLSINEEAAIYSMVNSIMDTCPINCVQIAINGETNLTFRETINLNQFFKMKDDIIQQEEFHE